MWGAKASIYCTNALLLCNQINWNRWMFQWNVVGTIFWICLVLCLYSAQRLCVTILYHRVNSNCKRAGKKRIWKEILYRNLFTRKKRAWVLRYAHRAEQKPIYASFNIWIGTDVLRVLYKFKILFLLDNSFRCEIANRTFFPTWLLVRFIAVPHSVFRRKLLSLIVHLVRLKIN